MTTRRHMPQPIRWSRVFFGVALGMLLLVSAQIALAGTTFIDGEKVETCQGSTCNNGSGSGGSVAVPVTNTNSNHATGIGVGLGGAGGSGGAGGQGGAGGAGGSASVTNSPTNTLTSSPTSNANASNTATLTANPSASATNATTVTASPRSSASSSAKSHSTSRSSSRSSASGGTATATGGQATANASNGNQTTSVNIAAPRAADLGRMVPDVTAPGLATGGDDVCLGSVSGGLGLSGLGAMLGFTLVDDHCQTIKATKLLVTIGRPQAAIRRACMDDRMRRALGDECPPQKQEQPPSSSSSFTH